MNNLLNFQIIGQPRLEQLVQSFPQALDTVAILDEGAAVLFNRMRTRFLQEIDPTGVKWPPSKAAEKRAASGRGGGTLFDTGKLFRSLQLYADSPTTRAIGTDAVSAKGFPYPKVHQFGWAGLPRRQFLGFGEEDTKYMSDLVIHRIAEGLGI